MKTFVLWPADCLPRGSARTGNAGVLRVCTGAQGTWSDGRASGTNAPLASRVTGNAGTQRGAPTRLTTAGSFVAYLGFLVVVSGPIFAFTDHAS